MKRFSNDDLRRLRNNLPIKCVMTKLLKMPVKNYSGVKRFLCPNCKELNTSLHPKENLGRCFCCQKNFNPIDIVMAETNQTFVQAVELLLLKEPFLMKEPPYQPFVSKEDSLEQIQIPHLLSFLPSSPCADD